MEYGDQVINLIRILVRHLKGKQNTSERYKMYNLCGICAYLHDPKPTDVQNKLVTIESSSSSFFPYEPCMKFYDFMAKDGL